MMDAIAESQTPTGRHIAWIAFWIVSIFFLFEFITRIEPSLAAA